jgi:hypothetical protein
MDEIIQHMNADHKDALVLIPQCDISGQEYFLWNRFCEGYLGGESREKVKAVTLVML